MKKKYQKKITWLHFDNCTNTYSVISTSQAKSAIEPEAESMITYIMRTKVQNSEGFWST
jgi:hypothetical protein